MEGALYPNETSLVTHLFLIAILCILYIEVVQNLLINSDFIALLAFSNFFFRCL